jgi:hypothetical protein
MLLVSATASSFPTTVEMARNCWDFVTVLRREGKTATVEQQHAKELDG